MGEALLFSPSTMLDVETDVDTDGRSSSRVQKLGTEFLKISGANKGGGGWWEERACSMSDVTALVELTGQSLAGAEAQTDSMK